MVAKIYIFSEIIAESVRNMLNRVIKNAIILNFPQVQLAKIGPVASKTDITKDRVGTLSERHNISPLQGDGWGV